MTGAEVGMSLLAGAATIVTTYVGLTVRPLEKDLEALSKRIDGLHDDMKDERAKFEARLAHIEQSYISRSELERTINSVGDRMDRGLTRVEDGMKQLGVKVDQLADRVTRVEAS